MGDVMQTTVAPQGLALTLEPCEGVGLLIDTSGVARVPEIDSKHRGVDWRRGGDGVVKRTRLVFQRGRKYATSVRPRDG